MERVLFVGETPLRANRYGAEMRNIAYGFHRKGKKVACLGFGYTGWPFRNEMIPFPLYPWIGPPNQLRNGRVVLDDFKPDTIILIGAPALFTWIKKIKNRKKYRIILLTGCKSLPLNKHFKEIFTYADDIVVNSRHEENVLLSELSRKEHYIAPGMEIDNLHWNENGGPLQDDVFRVACVARDFPQVDIPALL